MRLHIAVLTLGIALAATPARAAVTFQYLFDGAHALSVSNDGSVVAGTTATGGFEGFRWTQATGVVPLGRVQQVGGAGTPGISADGTRIAYSIGSLDGSYTTQGLWTLGSGWQELMPPVPPDGGSTDGSYGSVWDLSGDGTTAVGLYWRHGFGRAHASKWTQATGVVDLGGTVTGQASRANGVNYDGSVIAGWVETPVGPWRPAAWVNGSAVLLTNWDQVTNEGNGEARATSQNGDFIVGFAAVMPSRQRAAVMWKRTNGVFGPTQLLGWIEGSEPEYGKTIPYAVSEDGRIVVGWASYAGDPFDVAGFVWTQETGVVDAHTFLASNGVFVDPNFQILSLNAITPDGTQIFGFGRDLVAPFTTRSFRITVPNVVGVTPVPSLAGVELSAPSPNPSAATSRFELALAQPTSGELSIFDVGGRHVVTLVAGEEPAGRRTIAWDGRDATGRSVSAGMYFARLATPNGTLKRRVVRVN